MPANSSGQVIWDVAIIGAGPAGSAAACCMAQLGLQVLLVDAKPFPRRKVCGGCLNQVSTALVRELLGSEHPLWQAALPLNCFELSHLGRTSRFDLPAGVAVDRALLDQSLVNRAIECGATFVDSTVAKLLTPLVAMREVELSDSNGARVINSRVVVLASGLGNRSAGSNEQLHQRATAGSRLGVEAILDKFPEQYGRHAIHMSVGREGYVGLTQIAGQRLHVAAAVNRQHLQQIGPAELVNRILLAAGTPLLEDVAAVAWRGTPPLTVHAQCIADHRVFLIGDAAGYVEPFTGEGIRWALESGMAVAPLVATAVKSWDEALVAQWKQWYSSHILRHQRLCRQLSWGLKHSAVRWLADRALRLSPQIAQSVIAQLNTH
jgi:flavin-dependent dehydrogenase